MDQSPVSPASTSALARALVAAQRAIETVHKASYNEHHRFSYVSGDDMVAHARKALNDNDLAVLQGDLTLMATGIGPAVSIEYTVTHSSGECATYTVQRPIVEAKGRPLDKALDSAQTTGLSYFLRGLLQIPRSTDAGLDVEARDDAAYEPAPAAKPGIGTSPSATKATPPPRKQAGPSTEAGLEHALNEARTLEELRVAWELVNLAGKTGDPSLVALKDARKAELK